MKKFHRQDAAEIHRLYSRPLFKFNIKVTVMGQKPVVHFCDLLFNSLHRVLLVLLVLLVSLDLVDLLGLKELLDLSGPKEHLYVITG